MNKIFCYIKKPVTYISLSILLGFLISALILLVSGYNPIQAYKFLIKGVFGKPKYIVQTIILATPFIITGLSVCFSFKTGLFNIGAEGQFIIGSIIASFIGYKFNLSLIIHPIVIIISAILIAGLYGAIVGLLKVKYGVHEVITSIMLNWIALYFNNYYVTIPGIFQPNSESTYEIQDTAKIKVLYRYKDSFESMLKFKEDIINFKDKFNITEGTFIDKILNIFQDIILKTDINYGILIAIFLAIILKIILEKTTFGYQLKAVGLNKEAAGAAGINVKKSIIISMFISGAISGLAGAIYITGMNPNKLTTLFIHENYGFNGLSVAFMANLNLIACIFTGLFFGCLIYGGNSIQSEIGVPSEIMNIMIGIIIFFIGMRLLFILMADKLLKGENRSE